jgi:hypothetical protein
MWVLISVHVSIEQDALLEDYAYNLKTAEGYSWHLILKTLTEIDTIQFLFGQDNFTDRFTGKALMRFCVHLNKYIYRSEKYFEGK